MLDKVCSVSAFEGLLIAHSDSLGFHVEDERLRDVVHEEPLCSLETPN